MANSQLIVDLRGQPKKRWPGATSSRQYLKTVSWTISSRSAAMRQGTGSCPRASASKASTDPVVTEKDIPALKERMEKATSSGGRSGSCRTPVISHRAGPGAMGDAVRYLDWHEDGRGYRGHDYTGSPAVDPMPDTSCSRDQDVAGGRPPVRPVCG